MYLYVSAKNSELEEISFVYTEFFAISKINTNKASLSPVTKNQLCLENQYHWSRLYTYIPVNVWMVQIISGKITVRTCNSTKEKNLG